MTDTLDDDAGIPEDGYRDVLYEDAETVEVIRGEDGYHVVKKGIRPFFARLFADGAKLDLSSIKTDVNVRKGGLSKKVYTDPDEEENIKHEPAKMERRMPVWHRLPDLDDDEEHDTATKAIYGALTLTVLALPFIGAELAGAYLNAPLIGMAIGGLILTVESYGAKNGDIQWEPAPRHFVSADASLTIYQNEYADGKTIEQLEEIAHRERTKTGMEARNIEKRRDETMTQILNENALGIGSDVLGDPIDVDEERLTEDERRRNGSEADPARTDGGDDEV